MRLNRTIGIIAAIALIAVSVSYWYWSPLLALHQMQSAAKARDADEFNRYVDYAKLRESLKGQFAARVAGAMGDSAGGSDAQKAGTALGTMWGMALVDRMIDAMVRPEFVMKAMEEGKLKSPIERAKDSGSEGGANRSDTKWTTERKGVDRIVVYGAVTHAPVDKTQQVGFVFDREGFVRWKLTEVRLPASM